jgi:hypothetical protein
LLWFSESDFEKERLLQTRLPETKMLAGMKRLLCYVTYRRGLLPGTEMFFFPFSFLFFFLPAFFYLFGLVYQTGHGFIYNENIPVTPAGAQRI